MSRVFAALALTASARAASATMLAGPIAPERVCTRAILSRCRAERVARARVTRFHSALEPLDTLGGRAVREPIRHHAAGRHALQPIVANRRRRAQRLLGIARLELDAAGLEASLLRGRMAPDTGEAIGLEFQRHRGAVRAAARSADPFGVAEEVLHVMPDLVGDHVRLREVARRREPLRQLVEEPEIEIDLAITRTVERSRRGFSESACRLDLVAEEYDACSLVAAAENLFPRPLRVLGDGVDHIDQLFFGGRGAEFTRRAHRSRTGRWRHVAEK